MAQGQSQITVIGNVGGDPELRFTPSGAAVCNFNVGQTPRTFDKQTNDWKDGETQWFRCAVWRTMAENVAESIQKGDRVIVTGVLRTRTYEKREGGTGLSVEIDVDEVGHSLRFGTSRFTKGQRTQGQQQSRQQQSNDPWAGAGEPPYSDEPPF